jgi:DNA-binding transcriptional LysR family regulator
MDWDKLKIFYTVALCKSHTKAGEALGLSQSAVSRKMTSLEERLGTPLFIRHARGLMLSEQGEIMFRTVSEMVQKLEATQSAITETSARPKGPFKLTAPSAFTNIWLARHVKEFTDRYPDIDMTLLSEDRELDLTRREADAAIRFYPTTHPDMVQVPIVRLGNSLYASNDYLRRHGAPSSLKDLKHHKLLGFEETSATPFDEINWLYHLPEARKIKLAPHFRVNSLFSMRVAVKQGMGIAPFPDYMMYRARHVAKVLPDITGPSTDGYYVYPTELRNSKRVAAFKNFVQQKIAETGF